MLCTWPTKPCMDFLQCMIPHLLLWNFARKIRLRNVSIPNNSCHNRIKAWCIVHCEIGCTQGPLGYVSALSAACLVHWLILVAPWCLRSHDARYIMLKSLNAESVSMSWHHYAIRCGNACYSNKKIYLNKLFLTWLPIARGQWIDHVCSWCRCHTFLNPWCAEFILDDMKTFISNFYNFSTLPWHRWLESSLWRHEPILST